MNFDTLPPRLRPLSERKSAILSVLDIGTSKVVCLIARLNPNTSSEAPRGRTHRCRILGIGHQRSRGVKGGAIIDMDAIEDSIRRAVDAAERMAGVEVESVIINGTGGRLGSQLLDAKVAIGGRAVAQPDIHRVLEACTAHGGRDGRAVLHSLPIGFSIGETRHIEDPRGMIGEELGAEMHVLSCDAAAARNLMLAVERCHLRVDAMVATPYAAGLSVLADDEAELGAALIDMGGGTTTVSMFAGGNLTYVDGFALGGNHVTTDIARGLSIRLADAERLKTLYGACMTSASDERETVAVVQVGEDGDHPAHLPKSNLIAIIKPRVEEILEVVRDRLKASGFPGHAGRRIVLTGGASQLSGMPEAAKRILSGQVRLGRPLGVQGLPESAKNPAFSAAVGLLVYPQVSGNEHFRPSRVPSIAASQSPGYMGRVGRWLKSSF
ncbi:cell division protein FtsA [Methylocella silvestris]|uniref:Cell division protein FtsA n=1 Tax=Methylocella silvestris TaxID=199596 RepID=A0A2J7TLC5_METSI|nr:cell division protein FtsA [Methylocella silvestris]PNG27573.1 cell division protein FtsA [Methylocella silvestris]